MASNKSKQNGSAETTGTNASAEAEYRASVEEGKAITAAISGKQWALGDLADKVVKAYGENRIKQFAEDINFRGNYCTLGRYRDVCRAFPKERGRPRFFACAQALAGHPDRFAIFEGEPDISKKEARALMKKWRDENPTTVTEADAEDDDLLDDEDEADEPTPATSAKAVKAKGARKTADAVAADELSRDLRQWHSDVVVTANKAIELAEVRKRCSPEQHRDLLAVLEPPLIETVRKASEAFGELARWLHKLSNEAANTAIREGRVKTAPPKRPQEPRAEA